MDLGKRGERLRMLIDSGRRRLRFVRRLVINSRARYYFFKGQMRL